MKEGWAINIKEKEQEWGRGMGGQGRETKTCNMYMRNVRMNHITLYVDSIIENNKFLKADKRAH